jgi:hypothetical protein
VLSAPHSDAISWVVASRHSLQKIGPFNALALFEEFLEKAWLEAYVSLLPFPIFAPHDRKNPYALY